MTDGHLLYEVTDGIATITINRPERRNALSLDMMRAWQEALADARSDADVKVVVVTGAGPDFCAGGDMSGGQLKVGGTELPPIPELRQQARDTVHAIARAVRQLDKPYLAAIDGMAAGAGMDLASMADLRFASETARFCMSFVKVGVVPADGGCYYLPRIIGLPRALHLIWSGETMSAQQALDWGYVHAVAPPGELRETVRAYARRLADGPSIAIGLLKRLVYDGLDSTEDQALEMAALSMATVMATEDAREGPRAFAERRPPAFTGR